MATFVTDDEVEKALDFLRDSAAELGELAAHSYKADRWVKHVIAIEMKRHEGSAAAQEREALASQAAIDASQEASIWFGKFTHMKALREAASAKIEAWRTASSNFRSMKL
jgi:hypothetical protein